MKEQRHTVDVDIQHLLLDLRYQIIYSDSCKSEVKKQNKMPWWHLKGQKRKKKPLHIIFNRTAQKNEDDGIKHQTKARGETIAFMPLISAVLINLKHVIRDRRSSALQTLFIPQSSTFSSAQSSVSQRAQVWQGFATCHLLRPRLHVHSTSICLKPFSLTNSEPAPTIALHTIPNSSEP